MGLLSDLKILHHLAFAKVTGDTHRDRLEAFYHDQAGAYDDFRKRLLHGRERMMSLLDLPEGGRLLDMGGGTGSNFEALPADRRAKLSMLRVVDLSPSLLRVADERFKRHGWSNASTVEADATVYEPPEGPVDAVTFSYSLTMIPDWFRAIDHAYRILKPGGLIGVADFYVSRKWPAGKAKHNAVQRLLWPGWFSNDNVFLSPDHLPYLQSRFQTVTLEEGLGKVPYLLGLKVPYYVFVGRKVG
jgi:S-adenosylmethionine-diacylgycerolhomoserine-N-methlytransferase